MLADRPFAGRPFSTKVVRLRELRRFPVSRPFEKHLIFYKPAAMGIDVVRVLHGARDIEAILADEERQK
jgi:toxin ParE1/3/4